MTVPVRVEIVALLVDVHVDPDQPPEKWVHSDDRPVTSDEAALLSDATYEEMAAARDYHQLALAYDQEHLAALEARRQSGLVFSWLRRIVRRVAVRLLSSYEARLLRSLEEGKRAA